MDNMQTRKQPLLSFAIPTYNFGKFIAETVITIEDGAEILASSQFEIVILDGGSYDNTYDVVHELTKLYTNIRYIKQVERGGIDRDINTVAEMTMGEYIWFFSADDLLERGWDKYIVPLLYGGGDIFLVSATLCDIQMLPLRHNPIFVGCAGHQPIIFNISPGDDSLFNYMNRAATMEALFSFMGAVIVNASVWRSLPEREDYFGSCWAHCARLMPLFYRKTKIIYLNRFLINKRSGNDSFLENGIVARIALTVDGWDRIINEYFVEASLRQVLYNVLRKDLSFLLFIRARISSKKTCEIERLNEMVRLLYLERNSLSATRSIYFIYRLLSSSTVLNAMIRPFLPTLIRIRHSIKSILL